MTSIEALPSIARQDIASISGTSPAEVQRPEWGSAQTIRRFFDIPRSTLYDLAAKGLIRTASFRQRGKIKGKRLFSLDSIADWIERHASGGDAA